MKVALFDFCDTIVNFQTADVFVRYCLNKENLLDDNEKKLSKLDKLMLLSGLKRDYIKKMAYDFFCEMIKPNLYKPVVDLMKWLKTEKKYNIYVVSGGYQVYIDFFCNEYNLDGVISNDFIFENNVFTGNIIENDCMGIEKVYRVKKYFQNIEVTDTIFVSDSISDKPLLDWVDVGIVVSKEKHRNWCDEYRYQQIVIKDLTNTNDWEQILLVN